MFGLKLNDFFCILILFLYQGYNHPSMLDIWKDDQNIRTLVNRPALGFYPNVEWPDMLKRVLLSVAPPGLNQVMARLITAEAEVVAKRVG